MKVIEVPVSQIAIGERRRTDMGDIAALAKGIKRVGLLEPIIVDRAVGKGQYRLVIGERRLRAVRLLRWKTIGATLRENLSDHELRDIELEENENRKDLTAAERRKTFRASKQLIENAQKATEVLGQSAPKPQNSSKGGRPQKPAAKDTVAAALGTNRRDLVRAEQHVNLAERYPWLQSLAWRQADVLRLRTYLEAIPREEQDVLCGMITRFAAPLDPRPDRVMEYAEVMSLKTPGARQEIYRLSESRDEREQDLARTRALHRPPMPDARMAFIREALPWLQKAVKAPYDREPEANEFGTVLDILLDLQKRITAKYEHLKKEEAQRVEEDIRRQREEVSA